MNMLLLAFALPVATVLLAIVLQKILKSPLLVAATFFAIFLIVTYAAFNSSFLVFAILYTILSYVTAVLTRLVCNLMKRFNIGNNGGCAVDTIETNGTCERNDSLVVLTNRNQNATNGNTRKYGIRFNCPYRQ